MLEFVEGARRTAAGVLRRAAGTLYAPPPAPVPAEARRDDAQLRSVVDELAALMRSRDEELRSAMRTAAERELHTLQLITQAVAELAATSRQQHDEMRELLRQAAEQQLQTLAQVADAVRGFAAVPRPQEIETPPPAIAMRPPHATRSASASEDGWSALL